MTEPKRISLDETVIGSFELPNVRITILAKAGKVVQRIELKRPEGVLTMNFSLDPENAKTTAALFEHAADMAGAFRSIAKPGARLKGN